MLFNKSIKNIGQPINTIVVKKMAAKKNTYIQRQLKSLGHVMRKKTLGNLILISHIESKRDREVRC